jgi:hypothetical protein
MKVTNEVLMREIIGLKKAVDLNTRDIVELKQLVAQGRGVFKTLAFLGTIAVAFLTWWNS